MYNYVQIVGGEEVWRCVPVGQIEAFKALFQMNARPPQGLNEREVVEDTTG